MQLSRVGRSLHSALLARSQQQPSVRSYNVAPLRVVKTQEKATVFDSDDKEDFVGPDLDVRDNQLQSAYLARLGITVVNQLITLIVGSLTPVISHNLQVNAADVAALLVTLTSETEIAQLHLTMGSFQLKVRRNVQPQAAAPPPTLPPPSAQGMHF